ncbi:hypothetical protein [Azospirillum sp. sgz302134]
MDVTLQSPTRQSPTACPSYGVILITRDRPDYLRAFAPRLRKAIEAGTPGACRGVAVVDDSLEASSRAANAALCVPPLMQLTAVEQERLLDGFAAEQRPRFGRRLGDPSWSVGTSRNVGTLAFLADPAGRPDVLVYLDDDLDPQPGKDRWLVDMVEAAAGRRAVAGYPLGGMPDESRLLRIRRRALANSGRPIPDSDRPASLPISGGCVAIPASCMAALPYSLLYNEDYFLFMELEAMGVPMVTMPDDNAPWHRHTKDTLTLGKLQLEALGDIIHHAMLHGPAGGQTLDWLAANGWAWTEAKNAYLRDLDALRALCAASPSAEDHAELPLLSALGAWLEAHVFDMGPVAAHALTRKTWAERFAVS